VTADAVAASSDDGVQAAGAVLWRRTSSEIEVALVHRPKYDDWTFPKGKLDEGESHEEAALREVEEETACSGAMGVELASTSYSDAKGRSKTVRYWAMKLEREGDFVPNSEIDAVRWVRLDEAERVLSYAHDLDVLASFIDSGVASST